MAPEPSDRINEGLLPRKLHPERELPLVAGSCRWRSPKAAIRLGDALEISDRPLSTHKRRSWLPRADLEFGEERTLGATAGSLSAPIYGRYEQHT